MSENKKKNSNSNDRKDSLGGSETFTCLGCGKRFNRSKAERSWMTMGGLCLGYCCNCGVPF